MLHMLVLNLYLSLHPLSVESAWVEIPQIPSDNKQVQPQFVFGAPKVSFVEQKFTTPSDHKTPTTTPKPPATTLATYEKVMTSTTISPLTTPKITEMEDRKDDFPKEARRDNAQKKEESSSGFLPLLQSIQETLTLNAKKSLKSKISLLANLRDNLLANIDERMSNLWNRNGDVSEARGHDDEEMDFPSNEGALMTIGFLTFAVFLIKLVLKLIHALKYKQNNVMVVTTTAPAAAFIGRKKRQIDDFDSSKILQFIEEYKFS